MSHSPMTIEQYQQLVLRACDEVLTHTTPTSDLVLIPFTVSEANWLHTAIHDAMEWNDGRNCESEEDEPYVSIFPALLHRVKLARYLKTMIPTQPPSFVTSTSSMKVAAVEWEPPPFVTSTSSMKVAAVEWDWLQSGCHTVPTPAATAAASVWRKTFAPVDPRMCMCGHKDVMHSTDGGCEYWGCTCGEFLSLADEDRALMHIRAPEDVPPATTSTTMDVKQAVDTISDYIVMLQAKLETAEQQQRSLQRVIARLGEMTRVMDVLRRNVGELTLHVEDAERDILKHTWRHGGDPDTDPDLRRLRDSRDRTSDNLKAAKQELARVHSEFTQLIEDYHVKE